MLPPWVAGAILGAAVILLIGVIASRRLDLMSFDRVRSSGALSMIWLGGVVLVGTLVLWTMLDRSDMADKVTARRALDARSTELTARAITPGSALACLDAVANTSVEEACEKALFASPEAAAAAVAYTDARLALLADGLELARRDRSYEPVLERLRRGIETDRYGVVAHVLAMRGCRADACAAFKLLRDAKAVARNIEERTFDANVVMHAVAWRPEAPAMAGTPPQPATAAVSPAATPGNQPTGIPLASKYDFPSSASIPPISIMNAEPPLPAAADPNAVPAAQSKPPAAPAARRQSARETPAAREPQPAAVPMPPPPPMQLAPPAAPAPR